MRCALVTLFQTCALPILNTELEATTVAETIHADELKDAADSELSFSLQDFVEEFGDELLDSLNRANPPVYNGTPRPERQLVLAGLKRQLFPADRKSTRLNSSH